MPIHRAIVASLFVYGCTALNSAPRDGGAAGGGGSGASQNTAGAGGARNGPGTGGAGTGGTGTGGTGTGGTGTGGTGTGGAGTGGPGTGGTGTGGAGTGGPGTGGTGTGGAGTGGPGTGGTGTGGTGTGGAGTGGAGTSTGGTGGGTGGASTESPSVVSLSIPLVIEANKNVQITATLAGADNDVVQFSWKADQNGGGAFSPAQGSQQLGATGSGTLTTNYQAPTLAGGFGQTLTVSSSNGQQVKSFNVNIAVPQYIGYPTAFSPSLMASTSANFLIGEQVTASAAATVVRLGFISGAPSQNVQLAMYSDLGGKPDILVAATAVVPVIQGANEIAVTQPYLLSSGSSYWLMAVFSASTLALQSTSTNTNGEYIAFSIETSLPSPYPTTPPAMFGTYNFYAVTLE